MENKERKSTGVKPGKGVKIKGRGAKNVKQTMKRLMGLLKDYKGRLIAVFVLILISSLGGVASSMFIGVLIDEFIVPLTMTADPVFTGLAKALVIMAGVYIAAALATLLYSRIMVVVAQNILKDVRDDMFSHMQKLPIR